MKSRSQRRRDIEVANFQRQSQALTILTIGTVIFGGALFQVDISIDSLISSEQVAAKAQIALVLLTGIAYIALIAGVRGILTQTAPVEGRDLTGKLVNPLLLEVAFAVSVFVSGTMVEQPLPSSG